MPETLDVSRSNLVERPKSGDRPWQSYCCYSKGKNASLLPRISRLTDEHATEGDRRITAHLKPELASASPPRSNIKRVYQLIKVHKALLARYMDPSAMTDS